MAQTLRVNLTDEEWQTLQERAAEEERSLANYVTRLLRAALAQSAAPPQSRRGRKLD
jgi:plasmid stability protein